MDEEILSPHSINLLYEIIIHKQSAKATESFWYNRTAELSEEAAQRLRTALRELTSEGYIQVLWAGSCPAEVYVQPAGYELFRRNMRPVMTDMHARSHGLLVILISLAAGALLGQLPWLWTTIFH